MSEEEIEDLLSVVIEDTTIESERLRQYIKDLRTELNSLKEIEQLHQEENGKLRVEFEKVYEDNLTLAQELEQEKEKNKELEYQNKILQEKNQDYRCNYDTIAKQKEEALEKLKIATAMLTKGTYPDENEGDNDFDKQFISKDKIREILQKDYRYSNDLINEFKELLEEK